jgi:probable DNA repair protein
LLDKIIAQIESGTVVLAATSQQVAHLRWRYARQQRSAGRVAWPTPPIFQLSNWIEQTWERSLIAGGAGRSRALLTRSQSRELWRRIVAADMDPGAPTLRLIEEAWRILCDWNIPLAGVRYRAGDTDARRFAGWAARYRQRCDEEGWIDSVAAMAAIVADLPGARYPLPDRVAFCGFEYWHPGLQRLASGLQSAGARVETATLSATGPQTIVSAEFDEQGEELAAAADWAARELQARPDASIGLVWPDLSAVGPELRRRVLDLVQPDWRRHGPAGRVLEGQDEQRPADLGPIHAALLVLEAGNERMDYQACSRLLRAPFLAGARTEMNERAQLDAWCREHWQRDWSMDQVVEKAQALAPGLAGCLRSMRARRPTGVRSPAQWAAFISSQLTVMGWPGSHLPAGAEEAVQVWQSLLGRFSGLGLVTGDISYAHGRSLLNDMARSEQLPAGGNGGGIRLLRPADALGHHFDALWLGGLHSDAWPPPMRPNPLIPLALQRQAGIPAATPDQHASHAAGLLRRLLDATGTAVLSAAHRCGDEPQTPAPLLRQLAPREVTLARQAHLPSLSERIAITGETEIAPDPVPPLVADERPRGGARLLQLQSLCPARAFFELRLHARELVAPSFGIDAAMRGQLVHAALERLGEALLQRQILPADPVTRDMVADIAERTIEKRLDSTPLNRVLGALEVQRMTALLLELLALDARRPPFERLAPETSVVAELGELRLSLRIDRIDVLDDDTRLVIDYKTGAAKSRSNWFGTRLEEPQLPLYAVCTRARSVAYIRLNEDGVAIDGIAGDEVGINGIQPLERVRHCEFADWEALLAAWQKDLSALAQEFALGSCAIDTNAPALAGGAYAPLTRVYAVGRTD